MAQYFVVHPTHPQPRLMRQAASILAASGVVAYPTDSSYALGCRLDDAGGAKRIRAIRQLDDRHELTILCRTLADVGQVARLDNWRYRIVREGTPGSFTFLVPATREVPRRALHARRSTVGVRVSGHPVVAALLEANGGPMLTSTLQLPADDVPLNDPRAIEARLGSLIDLVIDAGPCPNEPTTVIDLVGDAPLVVRQGRGDASLLGIVPAPGEGPVA